MIEIHHARPSERDSAEELWRFAFGDGPEFQREFYRLCAPEGPLVLLEDGEIYRENLKKAKLDLSEFLTYCRIGGWFDLSQLQTAVFEHNGTVSFLPKEADRPATSADLNKNPAQSQVQTPFIMDGKLLRGNRRQSGKEDEWVRRSLLRQGVLPQHRPLVEDGPPAGGGVFA